MEDGTYAGRIPPCVGLVAFAETLRQCEEELRSTLEDWILLGLKLGHPLPVLAGIDLNQQPGRGRPGPKDRALGVGPALKVHRYHPPVEPGHYDRDAVIARMRLAFELYEASEQMMRLNLRRRYPDADDEEIERRIIEWLHTRPGAEHGDVSGPRLRVRKRQ